MVPVLCEAYSVIIRKHAIDKYYRGGWADFIKIVPNPSMCNDEELVRVGFLRPEAIFDYFIY